MNGDFTGPASKVVRSFLWWLPGAAVGAWAAAAVSWHPTPVDAALPFIVVVVTAVAAVTHPGVQLAVPLLLGGAIALADERQRLLWFGVVAGVAFGSAILWSAGDRVHGGPVRARSAAVVLTAGAVLLLRWIPLEEVLVGREVVILLLALLIVVLLGSTPLAMAVAVAAALFTTAVPLRTLIFPIGVTVIAAVARILGAHRLRFPVVSASAVALMLAFLAWSGALARALPVMLRGGPPSLERVPLHIALGPGTMAEVDVPPEGRAVIISGANVPRLKRGTVLGTIEPGAIVVRVGDVADWGMLRREHYYSSRNPLPRRPGGLIRGYGQTAFIDASGRIPVSPGRVTVRADPRLPAEAALQIDAIELAR
ncbi:MAG TPA: hypothetical protein VNA04_14860 [Thermoanaerobaculia bacterium]|nr:hypothetical protein [Thermoanaerobaculia bacterium]